MWCTTFLLWQVICCLISWFGRDLILFCSSLPSFIFLFTSVGPQRFIGLVQPPQLHACSVWNGFSSVSLLLLAPACCFVEILLCRTATATRWLSRKGNWLRAQLRTVAVQSIRSLSHWIMHPCAPVPHLKANLSQLHLHHGVLSSNGFETSLRDAKRPPFIS